MASSETTQLPPDVQLDPAPDSPPYRPGKYDDGAGYGEALLEQQSPGHRTLLHKLEAISTEPDRLESVQSIHSPTRSREEASRLQDEITVLTAEHQVSAQDQRDRERGRSKSLHKIRSKKDDPLDDFGMTADAAQDKSALFPPKDSTTKCSRVLKTVHNSSFLFRYIVYITPITLIILVPVLLGALAFKDVSVGGVSLMWFSIWFEILWLSLWAARIFTKCLPGPIGLVAAMFTNNSKKWRDSAKELEIAATLCFWGIASFASFLPIMTSHHVDGNSDARNWEKVVNKILLSIMVGLALYLGERIIMQVIAVKFHLRTYATRIEESKFQIDSLVKLYQFSKDKIAMDDKEFEEPKSGTASGALTPGQVFKDTKEGVVDALNKVTDRTGRVVGDFTGRQVKMSTHPRQVVLRLLSSTEQSQVLARRLYRTFCRESEVSIRAEDIRPAFEDDDEAEAAFAMFDKDLNGDISMEELEAVCVEAGRERKSITSSLKDLDSVVKKLSGVFAFVVMIISAVVFIAQVSPTTASGLMSAGTSLLALSWLFQATAQELLQSIVFVFVKHPFDVGDRVTIYGCTGSSLKGDDYFVKKISLLYTEFKKMEGHIVQAPNSYLNTLFILNQRRSGGLAEAVPLTIKYGTTLNQIDELRKGLLKFVEEEKRDYKSKILTELREVHEAHSVTVNIVFFYKSNWQNEIVRLTRRNKFICALMVCMQDVGIEGPRMRYPGQRESFPVYLQNVPHIGAHKGNPDNPTGEICQMDGPGDQPDAPFAEPDDVSTINDDGSMHTRPRNYSTTSGPRRLHPRVNSRGESLSSMSRRLDFSLGMSNIASGDIIGDVHDDIPKRRQPPPHVLAARAAERAGLPSPTGAGRKSSDAVRQGRRSLDQGASSSVARSGLQRVATDASGLLRRGSSHRNRFFGKKVQSHGQESKMEEGMADIPEERRRKAKHSDPSDVESVPLTSMDK